MYWEARLDTHCNAMALGSWQELQTAPHDDRGKSSLGLMCSGGRTSDAKCRRILPRGEVQARKLVLTGFLQDAIATGRKPLAFRDDQQPIGMACGRPGGTVQESRCTTRRERVPLVVLLRGLNVGGHRTFRPTALAAQLQHLDVVNIGAAGTFVIRQPVGRAQLRAQIASRLPFSTEIVICPGRDIVRLMSQDFFADHPVQPDIVRFVSVLSRRPRSAPPLPMRLPASGTWLLQLLVRDERFVVGLYRREMKAIRYLGSLDRILGQPVTTRTWNTLRAVAKVLGKEAR